MVVCFLAIYSRLLDKCPCSLSGADAAQVSRKPSLPFPTQMDDRCASYRPRSLLPTTPCWCVLAGRNSLKLDSKKEEIKKKKGLYLFNNLLHQISIFYLYFFIRNIGHITLPKANWNCSAIKKHKAFIHAACCGESYCGTGDRQCLWAATAKDR